MGNPYGTDVGFATGIHLGTSIWAPYRISHINRPLQSCILNKIELMQVLVLVL